MIHKNITACTRDGQAPSITKQTALHFNTEGSPSLRALSPSKAQALLPTHRFSLLQDLDGSNPGKSRLLNFWNGRLSCKYPNAPDSFTDALL